MPDTAPPRLAFVLAFIGVSLCGFFGAAIGYGLVHIDSPHATTAQAIGALLGGSLAALGGGVVAVLVLRAMSEWRRHGPGGPPRRQGPARS